MSTKPVDEGSRSGLTTRIAEALGGLVREPGLWRSVDATEQAGSLDVAVRAVTGSIERWRRAGGILRFFQADLQDELATPGTTVELRAALGPVTRLRSPRVRFFLGEQAVGEVSVGGQETVRLYVPAPGPGLYAVTHQALDGSGRVIVDRIDPDQAPRVAVVDRQPVVAVDAGALFDPTVDLEPLQALVERGFMVCYYDLDERDRTAEIRGLLVAGGLPTGVVLSHPMGQPDLRTLGVDFRRVFAATTVRRARADGVPLTLIVAEADHGFAEQWGSDLVVVDPHTLAEERETIAARAEQAAEAFLHRREKAADEFSWRLDELTGTASVEGNTCHVELDNRRARERVFEAIEAARHTVHLQAYILRDGWFVEQLAVRLVARARAGVRVRLLVDALYSTQDVLGLSNPIVRGLVTEPGIEVFASEPISTDGLAARTLKHRNHRKVMVIDGALAFVGGRNLGDEYYRGFDEIAVTDWTPADRMPWLDAHAEIRGPLVASIQRAFVEDWNRNAEEPIEPDPGVFPELLPAGESRARLVLQEGVGEANAMAMYQALISGAHRYLYILNDFPIVAGLAESLRLAVVRGVEVRLLTGNAVARRADGTFFKGSLHRELFEYMTKRRLEPLMHAGVQVREYVTPQSPTIVSRGGVIRPYVHAKLLVADGQVVSIGSANLDATASYWEREANVVVQDPAVVEQVEDRLRAMWEASFPVDPSSEYWRREMPQREITGRLWPDTVYS